MAGNSIAQRDRISIDDLVVDVSARRVFRGDDEIQLPKLSFDMLVALIQAAPSALSIDELTDQIWNGVVVSSATVAKRAELLRQALGDDSAHPKYVALVRGHGYRLIPTPAVAKTRKQRRTAVMGVVAALVLVASVATFLITQQPASPPARSIAVLPFENLSPERDNDYLSEGLAAELTDLLTTMPELKVSARISASSFRDSDAGVADIAQQLGVAHILSGTVSQSGNRLRISAQLIEAEAGYQVWSNRWEQENVDIFAVQDEIAESVIEALRLELLQDLPPVQRTDPEAYARYLEAEQAFLEDREPAVGEPETAKRDRPQSLLLHALAIDPGYAPAWALLSNVQYN